MSNVVLFLEALGRNPKTLSPEALAEAVSNAALAPGEKQALLDGNTAALNAALGQSATMMCFIVPAENDEPQEDEQEHEGDQPEREAGSQAA